MIEEEWKFNYATLKISFTKETSTNVYNRCDWLLQQLGCLDSLTALTAWLPWHLYCLDSLTALTAVLPWQLNCCDRLTAWEIGLHDRFECLTVPSAWQSWGHDSLDCTKVLSVWQSWLDDSREFMTVWRAWQFQCMTVLMHDNHECMNVMTADCWVTQMDKILNLNILNYGNGPTCLTQEMLSHLKSKENGCYACVWLWWQVRSEATCLSAEFWTRWKAMTRATLVHAAGIPVWLNIKYSPHHS